MAGLLSSDALASRLITLVAGKEQKELNVHFDILSQSETLAASVSGPFKETTESLVKLAEWEVDTVTSLVQWFYTRDYRTPLPVPVGDENAKIEETVSACSAEVGQPQDLHAIPQNCGALISAKQPTPEALRANVPVPPLEAFKGHHQPSNFEAFMQFSHQISRPLANGEKMDVTYTYTTTLMCHAKVYALADYLLLSELKKLAYKSISFGIHIIERFGLNEHTIKDVATLARYAYAHTNDHRSGDSDNEEPLRKRISSFIAQNYCVFRGPDALDLEHAGGELVQDILEKMRQLWEADKAALAKIVHKRQMEEDIATMRNDAPSKRGKKSNPGTNGTAGMRSTAASNTRNYTSRLRSQYHYLHGNINLHGYDDLYLIDLPVMPFGGSQNFIEAEKHTI